MRNLCLVLTVLFVSVAVVPAHADEGILDSGNGFLRECSVADKPYSAFTEAEAANMIGCSGYVHGLNDAFTIGAMLWNGKRQPYCNEAIESVQIIKIVLKYVRDHPAKAHLATPLLYLGAMKEAFPCSDKK
jgi:Rap1a immunity proteins